MQAQLRDGFAFVRATRVIACRNKIETARTGSGHRSCRRGQSSLPRAVIALRACPVFRDAFWWLGQRCSARNVGSKTPQSSRPRLSSTRGFRRTTRKDAERAPLIVYAPTSV